jgi:altronate dehydratase small subunit
MEIEAYIIDPKDNVATLFLQNGKAGTKITLPVDGKPATIVLLNDVPYAHKFAIKAVPKGEQVLKYGYSIGTATEDIQAGHHVHIHNTESNRGRGDLAAAGKKAEVAK